MRSRQTSGTWKSQQKKENSAQRAQNSATRATARRTTLHRSEEGRSTGVSLGTKTNRHILHSARFSKRTTRLPVHTSACLKHSYFLNTDRMGKRDGPTAVHRKPFSTSVLNNSDRDVSSSFRATHILRQGPVYPTVWNTSVFQDRPTHVQQIRIDVVFTHALSALRNASENVRPHSNIRSVARRNFKTLNSHSPTFPT